MACIRQRLFLLLIASLVAAGPAAAVTLGQIDDFQDGGTQGWGSGCCNPNPPLNVADMGPTGAGDHSLMITSTGLGQGGSRFAAFNRIQWTGDYLAAGVLMIVFDVNNISNIDSEPLQIRVAFNGVGGRIVTAQAVPVSPGSGWQTIGFSIEPGDLVVARGGNVSATLASVTELRIISAVNPTFTGDSILANGLVDNVTAVPEPSEIFLLVTSLATVSLLVVAKRSA